ncbi:MAG: hypothetical protein OXG04_18325 [Acidobacteria bacterium]|nr:hypothetical protein [Acidobacteriota bacterium]
MMNDIRWSEHPRYADVVKRVPPELHPTFARAVDLRAADAWLHEGTLPAGLDSDGKSLGGQQGPAFLRAAGRRYMRRWVTDEHGEQFGKGDAGMLFDKWLDEMLAFSAVLHPAVPDPRMDETGVLCSALTLAQRSALHWCDRARSAV